MTGFVFNPWRQVQIARDHAERLLKVVLEQRNHIEALDRQLSYALLERNQARDRLEAIHAGRSAAVSRGNRTRARRRRGALHPALSYEPSPSREAEPRTNHTG